MITTYVPTSEFHSYSTDWDALNERHFGVPILSSDFVRLLLDHFAHDGVALAVTREGTDIALLALVESRRSGMLSTWQPAQAPLGLLVYDRRIPLTRLAASALAARRWTALLDVLQQDSRFCCLEGLPPNVEIAPYIDTPWIECQTGFEQYWEALGKNIKRNTRKDLAKLEKQSVATRLERVRAPEHMARLVALHGELESEGWKGKMNSAISAGNAQGHFYTALLEIYAARSAALAFQYYYDDDLVASDFGIASENCAVILKTAYRQTIRDTSPGQLLRYSYFPQLFDEFRNGRIEFYGRALDWHARWTELQRPIVHVTCYRSALARTFVQILRAVRRPLTRA